MLILYRKDNRIKLRAQSNEDLWHLEKIIKEGDIISASTVRKFVADSGNQERKNVFIRLDVEKVSFHLDMGNLRILGTIIEGRPEELVSKGEHHTIDVSEGTELTIEKKKWMKYELDRIKEAEKNTQKIKLSILVIDDSSAELYHLREYGIVFSGEVHARGMGKYKTGAEDAKKKYYQEISQLIENTESLLIAGPGFEKDSFKKYLEDNNLKKASYESVASSGKAAINDLVEKGTIDNIMKGSRFAEETKLVEEFVKKLSTGNKVSYGYDQVTDALKTGAVETLLVVDSLLLKDRDKIEKLGELASKTKTHLVFLSKENDASQKIMSFGGIVAILRYSLE